MKTTFETGLVKWIIGALARRAIRSRDGDGRVQLTEHELSELLGVAFTMGVEAVEMAAENQNNLTRQLLSAILGSAMDADASPYRARLKRYFVDDGGRRYYRLVGDPNGDAVSLPSQVLGGIVARVEIGSIVLTVSEDDPSSVQAHLLTGVTVAGWASLSDEGVAYIDRRTDDDGVWYLVRVDNLQRWYRVVPDSR